MAAFLPGSGFHDIYGNITGGIDEFYMAFSEMTFSINGNRHSLSFGGPTGCIPLAQAYRSGCAVNERLCGLKGRVIAAGTRPSRPGWEREESGAGCRRLNVN